jgi:hypothetical protein
MSSSDQSVPERSVADLLDPFYATAPLSEEPLSPELEAAIEATASRAEQPVVTGHPADVCPPLGAPMQSSGG